VFFARAEALLLMNRGPSEELDESLRIAINECIPAQKQDAVQFESGCERKR